MYDYGARFYDPELGRFHTLDPLADSTFNYSAYHYAKNNPLLLIDPDGRSATKYVDEYGNTLIDTNDKKEDVVVIKDKQVDDFKNSVVEHDKNSDLDDPEVNKQLTEKFGYNIKDMASKAKSIYPIPGNDPFNIGFETGYTNEYKGRSLGTKIFDLITETGAGSERGEGSNFVIGKTSGRREGKSDVTVGKMNIFDPKIKNNSPSIVLPKRKP